MKSDRFEKKYMISKPQAEILRMCLKPLCRLDRGEKYWIRSLYFDTVKDDDRRDKLIGIPDRKKVRLRIYSLDSDTARLEVKRKHYPILTLNLSLEKQLQLSAEPEAESQQS